MEEGPTYVREGRAPLEARSSQTPLVRTYEAPTRTWIGEAVELTQALFPLCVTSLTSEAPHASLEEEGFLLFSLGRHHSWEEI